MFPLRGPYGIWGRLTGRVLRKLEEREKLIIQLQEVVSMRDARISELEEELSSMRAQCATLDVRPVPTRSQVEEAGLGAYYRPRYHCPTCNNPMLGTGYCNVNCYRAGRGLNHYHTCDRCETSWTHDDGFGSCDDIGPRLCPVCRLSREK